MAEHEVTRQPASGTFESHRFDVFISYSRRDAAFARRLHRALAGYAPPRDLAVPQRRLRVFRDESDFQGTEYETALEQALRSAAKLIVVCSPNSRASEYVGGEISRFAALRGQAHIVSVLLAGVPNNEDPEDAQQAFHDELVVRLPVPLAADYRGWDEKRDRIERDRFEGSWHKLLADIYSGYGVDRGGIEQREKRRQQRLRRTRTAIVSALTTVLASLTVWALISRQEAIAQRNTAQSRFLAAQSLSGAHTFDVAMLLAAAAQRAAPTLEAWEALFVGLQRQPAVQRFLPGAGAPVRRIHVGRTCAAAWTEADRTVLWDLSSGRRQQDFQGKAMPDAACQSIAIATADTGLELRSVDRFQERLWSATGTTGSPAVWAIDAGDTTIAVADADGRLVLRDIADGRIRRELPAAGERWVHLQFSADGRSLAGVDNDGIVHRWNTAALTPDGPPVRCGAFDAIVTVSRDLQWCASGGPGMLALVSLTDPAARQIDLGTPWILALDFSPDGRTLMAGVQGGNLQFWNVAAAARDPAQARPIVWAEHRSDVTAAAYAIDGRTIVSSSRDGTVIVWHADPSNRIVSEVARTPDRAVVAADADAGRIVMATAMGDLTLSFVEPARQAANAPVVHIGKAVSALALRRTGEILAGTTDGEVFIVGQQSSPRTFSTGHAGPIARIRLAEDDNRTAVITENGVVTIRDVGTGATLATFAGARPREGRGGGITAGVDAAFEPGGRRIVSVHGDQEAFLWEWSDGQPRFSPLLFRPISYFTAAAFAASGAIALGTGLYQGEVVLTGTASDAPASRMPGHDLVDITALAFDPTERVLFSGGFDGRVIAWDVAARRRIGEAYLADSGITALSYATHGKSAIAATERGTVLRWNLDIDRWVNEACNIANRDLTPQERARFIDAAGTQTACPDAGGPG